MELHVQENRYEAGRAIDRTVVFADVVDSTRLIREIGDARWFSLVVELQAIATTLAKRRTGESVVSTGDGVLAIFSRAGCAFEFGAELVGRVASIGSRHGTRLELSVGIASGDVRQWGINNYGLTMHRAARLCSSAVGGQVLVDAAGADRLSASGHTLGQELVLDLRGFGPRESVGGCSPLERV